MPTPLLPKALAFDLFGTVVDWRTGIARESAAFLDEIGHSDCDAAGFADAWRKQYIAAMIGMRKSGRDFVPLDVLHREMLEATLRGHGIDPAALPEPLLADWNRANCVWSPPTTAIWLVRALAGYLAPMSFDRTNMAAHLRLMLPMRRNGNGQRPASLTLPISSDADQSLRLRWTSSASLMLVPATSLRA